MDATQAIVFSDEGESDEEPELGQKKTVAFLHVLAQKDLSASKHPIYEGDNFIGRHDSNSIHMPYKALSKQHACIEVQGNSHLIYDMESRNKTRRGKMFLKPNVRYELRDGDNIIFGDVKCQYMMPPEEDDDDETGSETDSELMLQPPDSEETGQDDKYSKEDENDNESSFNLNDFLQPTQPCVPSPKLEFKTPRRLDQGKVFAADSDDESPNKSNAAEYGDDSFIPETQLSAKKKNDVSLVAESDSDTDIDETGPFDVSALASAQTQAVVATQAVDNMATQAVVNMATLAVDNMATQAVDNMATLAVDNMATQAVDNMATLAVDNMATQAVDNMATLAVDNMATQAVDNMATLAVDNMATQAVDNMETQAIDNMATQAVDNMATLAVDNMATQAVDNMATQAVDNMATLAVDNMATLAVDNMATQAVDNMATQAVDNMATQAVDNMATQAVDNMATQAVDNMATLAVDNMATQAVDNMATLAVDNMATQAVDYTADSDSSDTDVDEVRQSILEAPTQAVGLNDSRQHDAQTLVLDSSTASSDADSSPVKQASRGRNIYDEPTQACDGLASDSGSETDIEGEGMEAETQAVMRDDENKIDEMATVPIGQEVDEDTVEPSSDKTAGVEDMATVPIEMGDGSGDDDDDTDVESSDGIGVKDAESKEMDTNKTMDVEDMATVPIAMAEDDDDDTDVEEGNRDGEKKRAVKNAEMKDGKPIVTREDEANLISSTAVHDSGDSTEIESEVDNASQEYFLNYRTEQNPAEKEPPEIEATQPYGGPSDDAEDAPSSSRGDDVVLEATQPYGAVDDDETPAEPTSASSVTLEMSSTLPYGAEGETKQSDRHGDETDPTVPYEAVEDMETAENEVECTQAYGMQGNDTQVPDSQDGEDEASTSSRFPVIKTQSPSRSCLKQPNTPERKATRARRVTFEPADKEELDGSDEDDRGRETKRKVGQSRRQPKDKKSSEEQSTSSGARRGGPRVSQRNKDERLETTGNDEAIGGRSTRSRGGNDKVALKPGQKRKVGVQEPAATGLTALTSNDESTSAKRGRRQRGGKVEEEPDGGLKSVDDALTVTDAKPTRKKEFDAENPRPSRQGSKVKDERKLSDSSISSVGSEGSRTERALQTIVQIGKKLTRIRRGKKTSEDSEENAAHNPVTDSVGTRRSLRTAKVVDDGESDDTASISSTASSVKDFAEVEPSTRPRRGTRSQKMSEKVPEEPDGPLTPSVRTSRRGGVAKEGTAHSQDNAKKPGRSTRRGDAVDAMETDGDGQATQISSRTRGRGGTKGNEAASQDDGERIGKGEQTDSQNDEEPRSKRTKRGTVKTDTQEEPVGKRSMETVELKSKAVKQITRGKTKTQSVGGSDHGVQEETPVQEDKESRYATTRRTRRGVSESQEESIKDAEVSSVRQSGRRRTMPARFLDSEGKGKDGASQGSPTKQETRDALSTSAGVFAMPKPVRKPSKQKQQKEPLCSPQKELEVETAQTTTRGRRSTVKVPEMSKEKGRTEPLEKDSGESRRRGQQAPTKSGTSSSKEESKAEENVTTSIQRGRRATTKISEASAEKGKSEDVKGNSSNKKGRHVTTVQQKTAEDSETPVRNMPTPTSRGRKAASPASATQKPRDSKDKEGKDQSTVENKIPEVPVTRGKRGATATPPPSSPAKKPRQTDQMVAHSPSLRRRVSDARPKVMFTGVMDDSWQKTVTTLEGELVDSVHDCTHLITDKVRRTVKFLCCVARGVIIITPKWLDESKAAKMFIDAGPFQLKDKASERQYGFNLPTSLQKAGQSRLLMGYKIHVTPGVKPEPQQMKDIIKCAGGEYVAKLPTKPIPQMVVVSCDGDKSLWAGPTKAGIPVVSSEFILSGILRQEILLKDYKLK